MPIQIILTTVTMQLKLLQASTIVPIGQGQIGEGLSEGLIACCPTGGGEFTQANLDPPKEPWW